MIEVGPEFRLHDDGKRRPGPVKEPPNRCGEIDQPAAALVKDFRFTAAPIALAFIQRLGAAAERLNHHPNVEWFKREVRVTLSSRKSGGLTAQDAALARACDEAAI